MALSPIQLNKHDNRKNSGGLEVTGKWGGRWMKFEKQRVGWAGRQYSREDLHKIGRLAPLCQLCQKIKKFPIPPLKPFMKNFIPPFIKGRGSDYVKNTFSRTFCFPKLSVESWFLGYPCKNFTEYPTDITIQT